MSEEQVNHPKHYTKGGIETIDFIIAKELSYELGNVVKYVSRAQFKKEYLEDLKKAQWYLNDAIRREEEKDQPDAESLAKTEVLENAMAYWPYAVDYVALWEDE